MIDNTEKISRKHKYSTLLDDYSFGLSILAKQKVKQLINIKIENNIDILPADLYNPLYSKSQCEGLNIRLSSLNQQEKYRKRGIWYTIDYDTTLKQIRSIDILHSKNHWSYNGNKEEYHFLNILVEHYFDKYMKVSLYVLSNTILPGKFDSFFNMIISKRKMFKLYKHTINFDTLREHLKNIIFPKDYGQCFILLMDFVIL